MSQRNKNYNKLKNKNYFLLFDGQSIFIHNTQGFLPFVINFITGELHVSQLSPVGIIIPFCGNGKVVLQLG